MRINGIVCHEHGCPDAYKNETRDCTWCSVEFIPEHNDQWQCCNDCHNSYHGLDDYEGDN